MMQDTNHDSMQQLVTEIAKALVGEWRPEHLYCLAQAHGMYLRYKTDIAQCEAKLAEELGRRRL